MLQLFHKYFPNTLCSFNRKLQILKFNLKKNFKIQMNKIFKARTTLKNNYKRKINSLKYKKIYQKRRINRFFK